MAANIQRSFRNVELLIDLMLLVIAFELAHLFRYFLAVCIPSIPPIGFDDFGWVLFVMLPISILVLTQSRLYEHSKRRNELAYFGTLAQCLALITILMMAFFYLIQASDVARGVTILFFPFAVAILGSKFLTRPSWQRLIFKHLKAEELSFLLVGAKEDVPWLQKEITSLMYVPPRIAAEVTEQNHLSQHLETILDRQHIDCVVVSSVRLPFLEVQQLVNACEREGVEVWVVTDLIRTTIARAEFDELGGHPLLVFRSTPGDSWQLLAKRVIDLVVSLIGLILLSPVLLLIALAVRLDSPGPIFFTQERSGRRGKRFTMVKFRSMVTNAAMRQEELRAFNMMSGPVFKVENDPRITRLGRFLRRSSLDELPQLWNVLHGDMSLVGPRPLPVYETEKFENLAHRRRLSVKPGITGLWQVQGRNEVKNFEDWVRLDLQYIDNWSLWLDLKILADTLPAVLAGLGAK
ncbi:MAG: sugar transferase [Verrucomicrobiae bacterium]|nr:sugar transferase [Verrucomicrobiae bacterium]